MGEPLDLRAVEARCANSLMSDTFVAMVMAERLPERDVERVIQLERDGVALLAALRATRAALEGTAVRTLVNGTACWCTLLEPDGAGHILHSWICQERRAALATAQDVP